MHLTTSVPHFVNQFPQSNTVRGEGDDKTFNSCTYIIDPNTQGMVYLEFLYKLQGMLGTASNELVLL